MGQEVGARGNAASTLSGNDQDRKGNTRAPLQIYSQLLSLETFVFRL